MDQAIRNAALERLGTFAGEWAMEASGQVRTRFEWILDRQFLAQSLDVPIPDAPDLFAVIGVNSDGGAYTQHYFDSRGVARRYEMTFDDGVWTLLRNSADSSPLDFWQRFTGTFSDDGTTIHGRWEKSDDGLDWEHDFDLTYTRIK